MVARSILTAICLLSLALVSAAARPEHPRPGFRRDDWLNLNGDWQFRFDPHDRGLSEGWQNADEASKFDRKITVPFAWGSPLSGISPLESGTTKSEIAWYRRCVTVPEQFNGKRIWLCFGAVDSNAQVWIDGRRAGSHRGGYTPFEFDITDFAEPGKAICIALRVCCPAGRPSGSRNLGGGIWQTVWLEARPGLYVRDFRITPRHKAGLWTLDVEVDISSAENPAGREVRVELVSPGAEFAKHTVRQKPSGENGRIWTAMEIPSPKVWSPEDPHLYGLDIRLYADGENATDTIHTYFALRTIEQDQGGARAGENILLNSRPIYLRGAVDQPANRQGLRTAPSDAFLCRDMKLARSLGVNMLRVDPDLEEPRRLYWADRTGIILMRCSANGSKPGAVVDNFQDGNDICLWFRDATTRLRRKANAHGYANALLADVGCNRDGLLNFDRTQKNFGFDAFVPGMKVADLAGADFIGFDAPPVFEVSPGDVFMVPIFVSHFSQLKCKPHLRWRIKGADNLGQTVETPFRERNVVWRQYDVTFQQPLKVSVPTARPFVGALALELLDGNNVRLAANYINLIVRPISTKVLPNGQREPITRSPRIEILGPRRVVLRFSPDDFSSFGSKRPGYDWFQRRDKFVGYGSCEVKYRIAVPEFVRAAIPAELVLMAELSTKSDGRQFGGTDDCHRLGSQNETRHHPGRATIRLFDTPIWNLELPDDPADSRGVLSQQSGLECGSYGYLTRKKIDLTRNIELREELCNEPCLTIAIRTGGRPDAEGDADKENAAGISIFGEQTGRYPIDPTVIIETARDLKRLRRLPATEPLAVGRLLDRTEAVDMIEAAGGHEWQFTTEQPDKSWTAADDPSWASGRGGFGNLGQETVHVATSWTAREIWLRSQVQLPRHPLQLVLRVYHSGDAEIYVNGRLLEKLSGASAGYREIPLSKSQMDLFKSGSNTLAVHCRRGNDDSQAVDVGLTCIAIGR